MKSVGTLLPIHETYYGEISADDLSRFLTNARTALRKHGFSLIRTFYANYDAEQELWGIGELSIKGIPPNVIATESGADADLHLDWLDVIDSSDADFIQDVLKALEKLRSAA